MISYIQGLEAAAVHIAGGQSAADAARTEDGRTMAEVLAEAAGAVPREEMSVPQYRQYILGRISELPVDPSQALASHAVYISEEGFAAMQRDPEYEEWVLDQLARNFAFQDPWSNVCGGSYHVHSFGATKEQYHGESWFPGYAGGQGQALFDSKTSGCQWVSETPKKVTESERAAQIAKHLKMERMLQEKAFEHREFQSEMLTSAAEHRRAVEEMHRNGRKVTVGASPVLQLHGVSAEYLLAMLGCGGL